MFGAPYLSRVLVRVFERELKPFYLKSYLFLAKLIETTSVEFPGKGVCTRTSVDSYEHAPHGHTPKSSVVHTSLAAICDYGYNIPGSGLP